MTRSKILLVDDEYHSREIVSEYLKDFENIVLEFSQTPEEAITKCKSVQYALIILDIRLPRISGFELAKLIRKEPKNQITPLIFVSAYFNDSQSIEMAYSLGAVDFLTKPMEEYLFHSKVSVFIKLHQQKLKIENQQHELQKRYDELSDKEGIITDINKKLEEKVKSKTEKLNEKLQELEAIKNELLVIKNNLEVIVDQRTSELREANHQLSKEIDYHRQTKAKLIDKERELEKAQEIASVGSWKWDLHTDELSWSNAIYKIFDLEAEEISGLTLNKAKEKYVHPDDLEYVNDVIHNAYKNCQTKDLEFRVIPSDGEVHFVYVISYPVFNNAGKMVAKVGILQDITKQKRIQLELQAKKEQLKIAVDSADILAYDHYVEDELIYVSGNTEALFGKEVENYLKTYELKKHLNSHAFNKLKNTFQRVIKGQIDKYESEFKLVNQHGREKYFIDRGKVIDKSPRGKVRRISGSMVDVTRLRKIEDELKAMNDELEERVKSEVARREQQQQLLMQKSKLESLGELAAGIGHEISHPLSVMSLSIENIIQKCEHNNGEAADYIYGKLNRIQENIERISNIVKQIRIFSRDLKPEEPELIDLNKVIEQATSFVAKQYENHHIELNLKLSELNGSILGDKNKLEQVVFNLLSNSKYAVEEKARQSNSNSYQKRINVSTYARKDSIHLDFWDNGTGIAGEELQKIFDPFYTTKEDLGTGLGLSVVYGIIENMKGRINVESEKGKYTLFRIRFPKDDEKANKSSDKKLETYLNF